jgi:1,4-alpha-glucan branching enzyme
MITLKNGYVAVILHAHLPFVRHPEHSDFLEERWLFEAISETYIPLLNSFEALIEENIDYRVTMSITPPLLTMLTDSLLQERYIRYLKKLIQLSEKEMERTKDLPEFHSLSKMYNEKYKNDLYVFVDKYKCNIVDAFKRLQDTGKLEIIACAATHGYLPIMNVTPQAINAQINICVEVYEQFFGKKPREYGCPSAVTTP